jgi:hypothetical protein
VSDDVTSFSQTRIKTKNTVEIKWFMSKQVPPLHQGVWTEPTKFDQLRIKTDLQLVQVINAELSLGIRYAQQALKSADMWAVAEECNHRAKRAYTKLSRLIPVVSEITEDERNRVESRLEYLHGMLEALSAIGSTPSPADNEIAALARAVWKARGCPEGLAEEDWFRAERALKTQKEFYSICLVS